MRRLKLLIPLSISLAFLFSLGGFQFIQDSPQTEIERINLEIKLQGFKWRAGETSMSRLTPEERRLRLGARVPLYEEPSLYVQIEKKDVLPSFLDWTDKNGKNYLTSIRDQGSCGSCWAFSVVGAAEAMYNVENGIYQVVSSVGTSKAYQPFFLPVNYPDLSSKPRILALQYPDLSEQDLISCSGAGSCGGGYSSEALEYMRTTGVVTEDCFPYAEQDDPCTRCSNWAERLSRVNGWGWVTQSTKDTEAVKTALQDGPLRGWMRVFSDFNYYQSGIYEPTASAAFEGEHGIVIVGYDEAGDYWICKNSWGTDWGEDGYFRIKIGKSGTGKWVLKVWGVSIDNQPPVLVSIGNQSVKEGQEISILCGASDADGDTLTFSASSLPTGAAFDSSEGIFTWTPGYTQSGTYNIRFSVSDGVFEAHEDIEITVLNVKKGKGKY